MIPLLVGQPASNQSVSLYDNLPETVGVLSDAAGFPQSTQEWQPFGVLSTGLFLLYVSPFWQQVVKRFCDPGRCRNRRNGPTGQLG